MKKQFVIIISNILLLIKQIELLKKKELLLSNKEKDLVTQAMHELGNIYHYSQDIK